MTSEPLIRVARVVGATTAEGPGRRFAVWVQGCTIRCQGCFNPHMWTARGGRPTTATDLAARIPDDVEGVTLLGGEPFEQAASLTAFATHVRDRGLSVMTFTGHTIESLQQGPGPGVQALLAATDLLVDGPYDATQPDLLRPWVGSRNQRFHFLTDRYAHLAESLHSLPDRLEVRVGPEGTIAVNGWATGDDLDLLLGDLGTLARPARPDLTGRG